MTDREEQIPALNDVIDMELQDEQDRMWLVLFDDDYDEFIVDAEDSVALLVDCNQSVEVLRLASEVVGQLAPEHAPDEEPIDAMITALKEKRNDVEM